MLDDHVLLDRDRRALNFFVDRVCSLRYIVCTTHHAVLSVLYVPWTPREGNPVPQNPQFHYRSKHIARLAARRLSEITSGNITAALVNTYYTAGIIPARLRREVEGTPLFVEEACLWAAIAKALFMSRYRVKLEWIKTVLRMAVPSAYGRGSPRVAPFPDAQTLWGWLKENRTWGRLLRYLIDSGVEIGGDDAENQLPPHIADQADKG